MEVETNKAITFPDILIIREDSPIKPTVYKKPTHTGQYINYNCNHSKQVKTALSRIYYLRIPAREYIYARTTGVCREVITCLSA